MTKTTLLILLSSLLLSSCSDKQKDLPTQADIIERVQLTKADFSELKNWNKDNLSEIKKGFTDSCEKILSEKKEFLGNAAIKIPTQAYQEICLKFIDERITNTQQIKDFMEANFTPYLISDNGNEIGKFTSYYESALNGSYQKDNKYKYPIYGKPKDLIEINTKDFDDTQPNKRYVGRIVNQKLVPYYTREEISQNEINAPVILWGDSLIDINIMQIQGSAVATLPDGNKIRIGYAENNGHPFCGLGSILLAKGWLKQGESSMIHIKDWLKNNPDKADEIYNENKRYIFHRIIKGEGPIGAQGVALQAGRSLAVDRSIIPLGSLLWLETSTPNNKQLEKLVIAQDIGSAIKGIVRGDYFWGSGSDEILKLAGSMNQEGRYFILIPNTGTKETNDI